LKVKIKNSKATFGPATKYMYFVFHTFGPATKYMYFVFHTLGPAMKYMYFVFHKNRCETTQGADVECGEPARASLRRRLSNARGG
jgi:hypothetical protein